MFSSTFEVVPALEADMGDISSIFAVSFVDDHILGPANGNVAPDLLRAADLEFINELWRTREAFNAKFFKVVDLDTSKTIAFSKWNYPTSSSLRQEPGVKKTSYPQGANVELLDDFYAQMWNKRAKWMNPANTFFLHILATLPSYRCRGAGSLLVSHGLEVVDNAKMESYLDTSPMGLNLYLQYGWRRVDEIRVDLGKYAGKGEGGAKEEVSLCMIREPKDHKRAEVKKPRGDNADDDDD